MRLYCPVPAYFPASLATLSSLVSLSSLSLSLSSPLPLSPLLLRFLSSLLPLFSSPTLRPSFSRFYSVLSSFNASSVIAHLQATNVSATGQTVLIGRHHHHHPPHSHHLQVPGTVTASTSASLAFHVIYLTVPTLTL